MNGYLVYSRCLQDDIPLFIFDNLEDAMKQAQEVSREDVIYKASAVFDNDISEIINVGVATFRDGEVIEWKIVKDFDE